MIHKLPPSYTWRICRGRVEVDRGIQIQNVTQYTSVFVCDTDEARWNPDLPVRWFITSPSVSCSLTENYFIRFHVAHLIAEQFTVNLTCAVNWRWVDRKGCFLPRQRRCAGVERGPEVNPHLTAQRPLSPVGYKAALLWRAFPASSPTTQPGTWTSRIRDFQLKLGEQMETSMFLGCSYQTE